MHPWILLVYNVIQYYGSKHLVTIVLKYIE